MSIANVFCGGVHKNLKKYYGNWDPASIMHLGDIGYLEDNMFIYVTNIYNLGFGNFEVQTAGNLGNISFQSQKGISFTNIDKAKMPGQITSAGLEISFKKGNSLIVSATNCMVERFSDKYKLGRMIIDCKEWQKNWVVVTDLIRPENTNVIISENADTSILLNANTDLQYIDITDASITLNVASNNGVGYRLLSSKNITPFFCLYKIKSTNFNNEVFETVAGMVKLLNIITNSETIDIVPTTYVNKLSNSKFNLNKEQKTTISRKRLNYANRKLTSVRPYNVSRIATDVRKINQAHIIDPTVLNTNSVSKFNAAKALIAKKYYSSNKSFEQLPTIKLVDFFENKINKSNTKFDSDVLNKIKKYGTSLSTSNYDNFDSVKVLSFERVE